jgi:RND superfamily putative drug exporter
MCSQIEVHPVRVRILSANGAQGLILFEAPKAGTVTSASSKAAIESSLDALKKLPGVTSVTDPYQTNKVAPNGSLALANVNYKAQPSEITTAQQDALRAAPDPARDAGLTVSSAVPRSLPRVPSSRPR